MQIRKLIFRRLLTFLNSEHPGDPHDKIPPPEGALPKINNDFEEVQCSFRAL